MARGPPCPVHYFAKQVMDWKPLQTIVLQMALVPIDHPGRLAPDIGINGIVGRVAQTERVTIGRGRALPQPDRQSLHQAAVALVGGLGEGLFRGIWRADSDNEAD